MRLCGVVCAARQLVVDHSAVATKSITFLLPLKRIPQPADEIYAVPCSLIQPLIVLLFQRVLLQLFFVLAVANRKKELMLRTL